MPRAVNSADIWRAESPGAKNCVQNKGAKRRDSIKEPDMV
jgi:hypothetical protein